MAERRKQTYTASYAETFPCIKKSTKGETFAFCKTCNCDINIASGGGNDIKRHTEREKHKKNAESLRKAGFHTQKITTFVKKEDLSVIRAEVFFTDFLVEHNIQPVVSDHAGELFRKMFPDSNIAKKYACARTKTTQIIKSLACDDSRGLASRMKSQPFSIATDGSTDVDSVKLYPVLVKTFNNNTGMVKCELLAMKECSERSTSENIFNLLNNELKSWDLSWSSCMSFATDNASVMVGRLNGVTEHIKRKNPNVYIMGCPCHLMNLAARKGAKCLAIQVDDILTDVWYYLEKSSLRKSAVMKLQEEHGLETRKILKHVSTRWLSLQKCVTRLIDNWEMLTEFFQNEAAANQPKKRKATGDLGLGPAKKKKALPKSSLSSSKPKKSISSSKQKTSVASSSTSSTTTSDSTKPRTSATSSTLLTTTSSTGSFRPKSSTTSSSAHSLPTTTSGSSQLKTSRTSSSTISTVSSSSQPKTHTPLTKQFDLSGHLFRQGEIAKQYIASKKKQQIKSSKQVTVKTKKLTSTKSKSNTVKAKEPEPQKHKSELIYEQLKNPNAKLYALFLKSAMPFFEQPNQILQRDEPQIHNIHQVLVNQLSSMLPKFIKAKSITDAEDITKLDLENKTLQKPNEEIQVGYECKKYLNENKDKLNVPEFYDSVRQFYTASTKYMLQRYPFNDDLLLNAEVVDIRKRATAKFSSVEYFVERFNLCTEEKMDDLESEFNLYQVDEVIKYQEGVRIDRQWQAISEMEDDLQRKKYPLLCHIMKAVLVIFHSNADCERVFSIVEKNKRKERASMHTDTLSAIMTHKLAMDSQEAKCYQGQYSNEQLRAAKSATYQSLTTCRQASSSTSSQQ